MSTAEAERLGAPTRRRRRWIAAALFAAALPVDWPGLNMTPASAAQPAEAAARASVTERPAAGPSTGTPQRLPAVATPDPRAKGADREVPPARLAHRRVARRNSLAEPIGGGGADAPADSSRWLRSSTAFSRVQQSRSRLRQAAHEHRIGALASAEASGWQALRLAAESVDLSGAGHGTASRAAQSNGSLPPVDAEESSALDQLQRARCALREARDFVSGGHSVDPQSVRRRIHSHRTAILRDVPLEEITAAEAVDRYMNEARIRLSRVASRSGEAARAMDLLAAIHLERGEEQRLPSATALCLRRAALQGQPSDAGVASRLGQHLAAVGLFQEAQWALRHSLSIEPDAATAVALADLLRRRGRGDEAEQVLAAVRSAANGPARQRRAEAPEVIQLSPQEFAAVSEPVFHASSHRVTAGRDDGAGREDGRAAGASRDGDSLSGGPRRTSWTPVVTASHRPAAAAPPGRSPAADAAERSAADSGKPLWRRWSDSLSRLWSGD